MNALWFACRSFVVALCFFGFATPNQLAAQAAGMVSGRVVDASTQRPLAGASVLLVGTGRGTLTDAQGGFLIAGVPIGPQRLRATLLGYGTAESQVTVADGQTARAEFALSAEAIQMDEIVAIGYGTQRRRDVTGAISSVNVDELPSVETASSAGQLLQGRAAGVQVVQNNGAPGGGISIRIRGSNSITANSEPLYVIDGIPSYVGTSSEDPSRNPLNALSPQDIESIEVLKDASATAIYGSRGASGVVLITTRLGRRGSNEVTFTTSAGMQTPSRYIPMLNATQFAEMVNEARVNGGLSAIYSANEIAGFGAGTDWQRLVLEDAATQSHALSFSGGDQSTRYFVSGNLFDQGGIVHGSGFRRYSGRLNLDRTISDRFRISTALTLSSIDQDLQITDNALVNGTVAGALQFNPVSPVHDPETGLYVLTSPVTFPVRNPVAITEQLLNEREDLNILGSVLGEYKIFDGLTLRSSVGANVGADRYHYYAPSTTPIGASNNGTGSVSAATGIVVTNENILNYTRPVRGTDNLDMLAGFTVQRSSYEVLVGSNQDFVNDITGVYNLGAGAQPNTGSNTTEWALLSYLARANYSLLGRYIFTATGRLDGSSRFGENSKWAFFPSAAVAWRLIDEPFLRDQQLFSDMKLRLGFGVTGNQEIGLYQSIARLATRNYVFGDSRVVGYYPAGAAPNPDLKWETTRQFNAGIDLGFLDNRVTATLDGYHSVTDDLLLSVDLPSTSGYTSQLQNIGEVQNRGLEFGLNTVNMERDNFSWRSRLSVAGNRNEVLDLGVADQLAGPDKGIGTQTGGSTVVIRVGQPIGSFLGLRTNGIFQEGEACTLTVRRKFLDCVPGEYRYVDVNGDGRINADDREILGNGHPDFYGGFSNDFTFGPLQLSVFLQGAFGSEILNAAAINIRNVNVFSNQTTDALRRWTPSNTNTDIPRANAIRPREIYDVHVEDGSFLRLKTLSLGYTLPDRWIPGATRTRINLTGENLHVWTNYSGYDPEVNSFGGDAISRGIDLGAYPRPRAVNLGVTVTF